MRTQLEPETAESEGRVTMVWLDSDEALVLRWTDRAEVVRIRSDVPTHRRSTGHVRHDPMIRHGGGGSSQTAGEPHRVHHLVEYLNAVFAFIPPADDVEILGPGTVRVQLERLVRDDDRRHGRTRMIETRPSGPLTIGQLTSLLRQRAGAPAPRRVVGTGI